MKYPSVYDCSIIHLSQITSRAGNITPVTNDQNIPFAVRRVFYIYDIPGGQQRGAHSHMECHQFLISASGSFEVDLMDGTSSRTVL
ncbi:MAG TPA: WxcM-like domain-containing protein, partial [Membranihabitans sp.]|nr:WxcM-like domain-containing protein [Membranihabitans sp.]